MSRFNDRPKINMEDVSQDTHPAEEFTSIKSKNKKKKRDDQQLIYLNERLKLALNFMAKAEKKDMSEVARDALESYIPDKFKQMADKLLK